MDALSAGFWGGYFALAVLMLVGIGYVFFRGLHRVAINASVSLGIATLFVVAYLGWLPIENPLTMALVQAHVAILTAMLLAYMLLDLFGFLRRGLAVRAVIVGLAIGAVLMVWLLPPAQGLAAGLIMSGVLALFALGFSMRGALYGERMTRAASAAVLAMLMALCGLGWIALSNGLVHWSVHAVSAMAASAYLLVVSWALWDRYAYLNEVRQVLACGPSFDPVTRMPSHAGTSQMVDSAFFRHDGERIKVGVMVVTIGNLSSLEQLHGRQALNHALFVCGSRLRRSTFGQMSLGRLGDDGFVLLVHRMDDPARLSRLARSVAFRLMRPVVLSTKRDEGKIEFGQTEWVAEIGIGVIAVADSLMTGADAVARAIDMGRTAMAYPSRVAWFNRRTGAIAELRDTQLDTVGAELA